MVLFAAATAATVLALIASVTLGVRALKWVRANRGAATGATAGGFISESLGNWVDGSSDSGSDCSASCGGDSSDCGGGDSD